MFWIIARNRKRRRIARVIRLIHVTKVLMPTFGILVPNVVRTYKAAWRGNAR